MIHIKGAETILRTSNEKMTPSAFLYFAVHLKL